MPPAALVRMTARIPMRPKTRMGKVDFLRGISFIKMNAALHGGDGHAAGVADDHLSGVSDGGRVREGGNVGVGNARGVGERVGESAEAGAEDKSNLRAKRGA